MEVHYLKTNNFNKEDVGMKKALAVLVVVGAMVTFLGTSLQAKVEFAKKEGKKCTFCHVKAGKKDLNDVGKCYKEKKSIAKCTKK